MGPFPSYDDVASIEVVEHYAQLLESIEPPVTDEEAVALVTLFGQDDFYGLAWSVVHLVESAPGWPIRECLEGEGNPWISALRLATENTLKFDQEEGST
jgi:hypothetical protein